MIIEATPMPRPMAGIFYIKVFFEKDNEFVEIASKHGMTNPRHHDLKNIIRDIFHYEVQPETEVIAALRQDSLVGLSFTGRPLA